MDNLLKMNSSKSRQTLHSTIIKPPRLLPVFKITDLRFKTRRTRVSRTFIVLLKTFFKKNLLFKNNAFNFEAYFH
jgi:hypothetical protein